MGVLSPNMVLPGREAPSRQFRAQVPATMATAGFWGHHPTSLDPNSLSSFSLERWTCWGLGSQLPTSLQCTEQVLQQASDRTRLQGLGGVRAHTQGAGGRQSTCPPPELPSQALQCLSGSRSGAETEARWALVPPALRFPPCPRCANSGEPRVAGSNSRALSWLSSKARPLSGPQ